MPTTEDWRDDAPAALIAEDEGYEQIAQGILGAVERGPNGVWRMPWHALEGGSPENAFTGRRFKSTNLLTLSIAAKRKGFKSNLWAPRGQWEKRRGLIAHAEEGTVILVPQFAEAGPTTRWDATTTGIEKRLGPLGGDAEGGEQRRMIGFKQEPWFNAAQVDGLDIRPPSPATPSQAADRLLMALGAWRARPTLKRNGKIIAVGGPVLLHGGHQAFWNPERDQIMSPPPSAYGNYDGLSGLEFYATTLAHEGVHASGSSGRLKRSSLQQYGTKNGRAREEMVAELGAAFLCSRFGLGTALRPDHTIYIQSWMNCIGDRDKRRSFFWAVKEAERAADYILAQAGVSEGSGDPTMLQERKTVGGSARRI